MKKPRAFRLDHPDVAVGEEVASGRIAVVPEDGEVDEPAVTPVERERRRAPWGGIFLSAFSGLVLLGLGLWVENLILSLFAVYPVLGWVAAGLAALALLAFLALLGRETFGILRERQIERLRARASDAIARHDDAGARKLVADLMVLYSARPETARAREVLAGLGDTIIDPPDRIAIAERELMLPLDATAKRAVAAAAKQVSLVTAVSPRALVDVGFVLYAAFRLIRRLAAIYGGRPGFFGFLRLARNVLGHLALTGGMAAGDSLLQQVMGLGLAARVSARLGEGVLNGVLTARVGLAAMAVCRPLPFHATQPPLIADVAGSLFERKTGET
jgi:putative membrane protein